ncbi:MAG: fumarylacetoacetate hydrolase family protein [Pseudohongiellaceae bacterium]|nr:fumarylacetoacetate hydrolase family protein [Pseudohongiellaceae bacterium]
MSLLFNIERPSVAIVGRAERFPVNRIYCVGRNYAAHAKEMGGNPDQEAPFFFSKPGDSVVENGSAIPYPAMTQDLHHEVELVMALGGEALAAKGRNLSEAEAMDAVFGYAVGIDFTRRDLQAQAKEKGRPWDTAKGFDNSAPIGAITPAEQVSDIEHASISLKVNGEQRQQGSVEDLICGLPQLIVELSHFFTLKPGDLIYTGTPAGVSAVGSGDVMEGSVDGLETLKVSIV